VTGNCRGRWVKEGRDGLRKGGGTIVEHRLRRGNYRGRWVKKGMGN